MKPEEKTFEKGEKVAFRKPNNRKETYKQILTGKIVTEPYFIYKTLYRMIITANGMIYHVRVQDIIKIGKSKGTDTWVTAKPYKPPSQ